METFGAIIGLAFWALVTLSGVEGLLYWHRHCDEALNAGCLNEETSWRIRAWVRVLYFTAAAGLLIAGTWAFGITLVDLIF